MNRRSFLASLTGLAAAPFALRASYTLPTTVVPQAIPCGSSPPPVRAGERGIKVPSNRFHWFAPHDNGRPRHEPDHHTYEGDWDGTFKLERGCTNPAYVLADLIERTGSMDWVTHRPDPHGIYGYTPFALNWPMLYDWGRVCDELVDNPATLEFPNGSTSTMWRMGFGPRWTVSNACLTSPDQDRLRETLRMHCLKWQATDPRYQRSFPV